MTPDQKSSDDGTSENEVDLLPGTLHMELQAPELESPPLNPKEIPLSLHSTDSLENWRSHREISPQPEKPGPTMRQHLQKNHWPFDWSDAATKSWKL